MRQAVEGLPDYFLGIMTNVDVQVRRWPTRRQVRDAGLEEDETLLGLYEGFPITDRIDDNMMLPDIITIFQGPIEEVSSTPADVAEQIRQTVVHEVAHYFAITDAELEDWGVA